jgi:hypothetical protein
MSLLIFLLALGIWVRSFYFPYSIEHISMRFDKAEQPPVGRTVTYEMAWSFGQLALFRSRYAAVTQS